MGRWNRHGARLARLGYMTVGQLAKLPERSLERLLGHAAGEKLTALAWNRDLRVVETHRRVQSAGAQSALGKQPGGRAGVSDPLCVILRTGLLPGSGPNRRPGRTVTVRVRFADLGPSPAR